MDKRQLDRVRVVPGTSWIVIGSLLKEVCVTWVAGGAQSFPGEEGGCITSYQVLPERALNGEDRDLPYA